MTAADWYAIRDAGLRGAEAAADLLAALRTAADGARRQPPK